MYASVPEINYQVTGICNLSNHTIPLSRLRKGDVHFLMQPSEQHFCSAVQSQSVVHSEGRKIAGQGLGSVLWHFPALASV